MDSNAIAFRVESFITSEGRKRKPFERRWYNNNFFDDGFHYRFVSRTTGRIVDLSASQDSFIPYRAIPKASRQLRGVANLILANQPQPVIYPERMQQSSFGPGQYEQALTKAKDTAQKVGWWIEDEWKQKDFQEMLTHMVLLAGKHGVSYMKLWPNKEDEKIDFYIRDAFDVYVKGELTSIYDAPMIVEVCPYDIEDLKNDERFDETQRQKLTTDNKYASSEIKEAYMRTRFGSSMQASEYGTVLLKEAFVKERITDDNKDKVASDLGDAYKGKKNGDKVMRQIFEAAGVWLSDTYIDLPEYPFIDYRMEPGPIYQVPLIERFIPANKTLDAVMSRIERHIGTMAVGVWLKRRGENYRINNIAGGQEVEYDTAPPAQMQTTQLGGYVFNFIQELNSNIEEQGASTSALNQLPPGVKSGVAIEGLKAVEYSNLKIPTDQLKTTVKRIAERMIDYAATTFINPQTVYRMKDGNPGYFDVIGQKGIDTYKKIVEKGNVTMPDAVVIKKEYKVDIQIESGLGFTVEGKKDSMIKIMDYIRGLAQEGYVTSDAVTVMVKRFLEIFQFGNVSEFMDAMNTGDLPITDNQVTKMKVAMLEVIKDTGFGKPQPQSKGGPSESISFKDLPPEGKVQLAAQAGIQLDPQGLVNAPQTSQTPSSGGSQPQQNEDQGVLKIKHALASTILDLQNAKGGQ
jgi:hypothetical protein